MANHKFMLYIIVFCAKYPKTWFSRTWRAQQYDDTGEHGLAERQKDFQLLAGFFQEEMYSIPTRICLNLFLIIRPKCLRYIFNVNVKGILAHPHIWGTDQLAQKLLDNVFASEAISSKDELALQF